MGLIYVPGKAHGEGEEEKADAYYTTFLILVVLLTVIVWPHLPPYSRRRFLHFWEQMKFYTPCV